MTYSNEQNHQGKLANALTRAKNFRDFQYSKGRRLYALTLQSGLHQFNEFQKCVIGFKRSTTTNAGTPFSFPSKDFSWIGVIEGGSTGEYHAHIIFAFHKKKYEDPARELQVARYFKRTWMRQCSRFGATGSCLFEPCNDADGAAWVFYVTKHSKEGTVSCVKPRELLGKSYSISCRLPKEVRDMNALQNMPRYLLSKNQIQKMCCKQIQGYQYAQEEDDIPW